jgi:hypothetical protein
MEASSCERLVVRPEIKEAILMKFYFKFRANLKPLSIDSYFLLLDQKKVSKEKSRQKKATSRTGRRFPLFCRALAPDSKTLVLFFFLESIFSFLFEMSSNN